MKRLNFYLNDEDYQRFKDIPGTFSEKLRIAVINFIKEYMPTSASQSRKEE